MIKFLKGQSRFLYRDSAGKEHFEAMLVCDTAAELAGVTEVKGAVLEFGSIAHAVDDAQILRLDSSGDWIIQTGDDAGKTPTEVTSSNATLSAPKTALTKAIDEKIEGDDTGEVFPEVKESTYADDVEPLEPVEKSVEAFDSETTKAVNADDKSE